MKQDVYTCQNQSIFQEIYISGAIKLQETNKSQENYAKNILNLLSLQIVMLKQKDYCIHLKVTNYDLKSMI